MTTLLLVGASGHGRVLADLGETLGFVGIAFVDDRWPEVTDNNGWPVIGATRDVVRLSGQYDAVVVSIGANEPRLALHRRLMEQGVAASTLVHPSAVISSRAEIGVGSVVLANVVVGAFATVGEAAILNTACTVDHDCRLADGVHISPGVHLAGQVHVGERTWIGIGTSVREGAVIGKGVVIGAGAAVVSDIADSVIATGVPARPRQIGGAAT
ncbi:acetyltransferase [Bauldia litoralis]|uniref:Transferase hexapeptide (Six repeat-containing protein) n=1 Tax=Bauldia litoralis TaxID=665467 RepID=A0A1G6CV71_9HYPH|nr:acetyltransferase [Bauldia litoralis]SDB36837.1 transferase hexapeptide (six repeat-containing protein) [Bauldia litoralis]